MPSSSLSASGNCSGSLTKAQPCFGLRSGLSWRIHSPHDSNGVSTAAAAAVLTPFESCGEWIRQERPLRKPKQGWAFVNDPEQFPLALSELDGI